MISGALAQSASPVLSPRGYNSSKTYITFIIGDGDNIGMVKSRNYAFWDTRLARCGAATSENKEVECFPLVWSI